LGLRKEVIKGLSDSDYELSDLEGDIKGHPVIGSEMVRKIALLKGTMPIIRYHHERFDGTGYPDGLKGHTIPFLARIVAVVEAYEEIVIWAASAGVESKSLAVSELQKSAGDILDPELVEIFVKTLYTE
jgi:response regulator RpfG family c-di-GMP phosphodiesterase